MERRERISDGQEALRLALTGWQSQLWTAMPGIIQSFDSAKATVVVKCALSFTQRQKDGTIADVAMPELVDVPVVTPRGGGTTMTFPIAKDDECLVIFANRCIDGWWQSGGVQKQIEIRMHDLSDGFAFVGPFSQNTKIANWNTSATEIRSNDGKTFIRLNPTTQQIDVQNQKGSINVDSQTGPINVNTQSSGITVASQTGPINVSTQSSPITVASESGNVNVASASGNIDLAAIGIALTALTCSFLSNNGNTLLNLNPSTGTIALQTLLGNIIINSQTGNITIEAGGNIAIDATKGGVGNAVLINGVEITLNANDKINLNAVNGVYANGQRLDII